MYLENKVPYLIVANTLLKPVRECIVPPYTSKIVKYMIETSDKLRFLRDIARSRKSYKPITISPIYHGSKPLYTIFSKDTKPLVLSPDEVYWFRVSIVTNDPSKVVDLGEFSGIFKTPYGDFLASIDRAEITSFSSLEFDFNKYFKIEFLTPTILTNKLMTPPKLRDLSKEIPERHRLVPSSSAIFSYLARLWNSFVSPKLMIPRKNASDLDVYKFGLVSDVALVEVNYRLKPVTAIYGKGKSGKLKLVRGFRGWIIYELTYPKMKKYYKKLLALANALGIGRSRSIGFGQVRISRVEKRE